MKRTPPLAALLPMLWLAPVYLTGRALFWGTPALQFYPWWHWAARSLLEGRLPLWNPYLGMGAPLFANYQSALLYPPVWILLALDALGGLPLLAWGGTLVVAAHLSWAAWGMTRLTRDLGLGALAQSVAGLAFGMSGYLTGRAGLFPGMVFAAAWLPWVLLGFRRLAQASRTAAIPWREIRFLAFALGMQLLSGHAQLTWYTLLLAGICYLARLRFSAPRPSLRYAARNALYAALPALLLAAPQLLATAEYLHFSQRASAYAYEQAMTYSFWPWRALELFAPGMFGTPARANYWGYAAFWEDALYAGLLTLLLALAAWRRRAAQASFPSPRALLALGALAFALSLGDNTPLFPWLYRRLPTFDMFQAPTRWNLWLAFALALSAAYGAEIWRRPEGRALYWTRLATAGAFAITLGAGLGWMLLRGRADLERLLTMGRAFALTGLWGTGAGLLTLFHPRPRRAGETSLPPRLFPWLAAGWLALDLLSASGGLAPSVPLDFYRRPAQSAPEVRAALGSGGRLYLPAEDEYALKFERFLRFEAFLPQEKAHALRDTLLPNLNLPEELPSANNFDPLLPGNYARWIEALEQAPPAGRAWMLNRMGVSLVEQAAPEEPFGVRFLPREGGAPWRWAACGEIYADESRAWEAVQKRAEQGPAAPSSGRVVLRGAPAPSKGACFPSGQAEIRQEKGTPNRAVFSIRNEIPGWFIQSEVWYPGWQARLDGKTVPLWKADELFRGVFVPAGEHRLEIVYRPWWRWSILLSAAAVILLAGAAHKIEVNP